MEKKREIIQSFLFFDSPLTHYQIWINSEVIEICEIIKSLKDYNVQNKNKIKPNMMNI